MTPVEVEAAIPPRKRKPLPPRRSEADPESDAVFDEPPPPRAAAPAAVAAPVQGVEPPAPVVAADFDDGPDLLSELLGRGIATSLRQQHAALAHGIDAVTADPARKAAWRERLARLDPDGWESPEAVLAGMGTVQRDLDALTDELDRATAGA